MVANGQGSTQLKLLTNYTDPWSRYVNLFLWTTYSTSPIVEFHETMNCWNFDSVSVLAFFCLEPVSTGDHLDTPSGFSRGSRSLGPGRDAWFVWRLSSVFARGSSTTGLVDSRKIHGWIHRRFNCSIASQVPRSMRLKEPVKDYPLPQREQTMKVPRQKLLVKPPMTEVTGGIFQFF